MTTHPIPTAALDDRLAFVGNAGSGKTYAAGTAVERLLESGARVVIPDPLGVWWGMALSKDGKSPSEFRRREKLVIFGGPRGDLGLTELSGALIGETVAGMAESCILDLSELKTNAAERRFMLAFLSALYKHKTREPLHVVFDEADMWSPQRILDKEGEAMKLLGMMETICRRGRVKGFIPWLISQRPAVISKNVLSQIDGMIALKLTSVQDRDAIGDWVQGQADTAQWKAMWGDMATMPQGQGVVWLPARGILKTAQFPEKITFDSSRAPKRGERAKSAKALTPVNLDKLKERLATVEAESKANDPAKLRGELVNKNRELNALKVQMEQAVASKVVSDPDAIKKAHEAGFAQAEKKLTASLQRELHRKIKDALAIVRKHATATIERIDDELREIDVKEAEVSATFEAPAVPRPAPSVPPRTVPRAKAAPPIAVPRQAHQNGAGDGLPGPERRILDALASWRSMGHDKPLNAQVAWLAEYSPSSSSFTNARSALRTKGLLDYPSGDRIQLTAPGIDIAVASLPNGPLVDHVIKRLPGPEAKILRACASRRPNGATNAEIAQDAGYSPASSSYTNARSALRTKALVDYPERDMVRAEDWLFQDQ